MDNRHGSPLNGLGRELRLIGKRIKSRSKLAHYTLKWLIIGGLLYWIFV